MQKPHPPLWVACRPTGPVDRRLRVAADLYNVALTGAFKATDGAHFEPRGGVFALPFGELDVTFDQSTLRWRGRELSHLVPVTELEVRGLRVRYRRDGLGTALVASIRPVDPDRLAYDLVGRRVKVAVTALLVIERPQEALRGTRLRGQLTLHVAAEADDVAVDGRSVPLELDPTAAVAATLNDSPIWAREFGGFFRALIPNPGARTQLGSITPYQPGLIPVVFVHGTASSAVTLPVGVLRTTTELLKGNPDVFRVAGQTSAATSVDNMNPLSPFIRTLADIPVVPGVPVHSIIAVRDDGPPEDGNDGVVAYRSAYIDGGQSVLVVRSGHSVQDNPVAIDEVRRILRVHVVSEMEAPRSER